MKTDRIDAREILDMCPSGYAGEVQISEESVSTVRLAENSIAANTSVRDINVSLTAVKDNRIGMVSLTEVDEKILRQAFKKAAQIADLQTPDKDWPGLSDPVEPTWSRVHDPGLAKEKPWTRTQFMQEAVRIGKIGNLSVAGSYQSSNMVRSYANSKGNVLNASGTQADLSLTMIHPDGGSGWARGFDTAGCGVDIIKTAKTAAEKAVTSKTKHPIEPGACTVVLEPAAVGYLLLFLGFLSFGGGSFNRGTSFLSGKLGEKVMNESITLVEDPMDLRTGDWPFDYEGSLLKKVWIVEKGIARGVVHDRRTAKAAGSESTGHSQPSGNRFGPYPRNLHLSPGNQPLSEILSQLSRAILITRFWYINYVNPMKTMVTGTTRDGTFLIENGKIKHAVRDMRFIESILEIFNRAEFLSSETSLVRQFGSSLVVPAMVVPDFHFTEPAGGST